MTGDVVNLRRVRKAKRRAEDDAVATANRAKHGMTKAERSTVAMTKAHAERVLDGARIVRPHADGDEG